MISGNSIWSLPARINAAFRKVIFCFKIAKNLTTGIRLLVNTKKAAWVSRPGSKKRNSAIYELQFENTLSTVYLRTYAGDLNIFYDVFLHQIYAIPHTINTTFHTIIDLGAHIGMSSFYFNHLYPQAKIIAVEADPDNFSVGLKNLKKSISTGQIILKNAAIAATNNEIYLQLGKHSYNSSLSELPTNCIVQGITMEELIRQHHITSIDLIKIDIEGAELLLFSGNTNWLNLTRHIIIELHSKELVELFKRVTNSYGFILEKMPVEFEEIYHAYQPHIPTPLST